MDNLVPRLHESAGKVMSGVPRNLLIEAANRIERLQRRPFEWFLYGAAFAVLAIDLWMHLAKLVFAHESYH
jgi:hypothetical protein